MRFRDLGVYRDVGFRDLGSRVLGLELAGGQGEWVRESENHEIGVFLGIRV